MAYDPDIVYRAQSDVLERTVRWVCGAAFGAVPGLWIVAELGLLDDVRLAAAIVASTALACGYLAHRYGDAFWHKAAEAIRAMF